MHSLDEVRAVMAECVQRGKATADQLAAELLAGESAGSMLPRRVLAEVSDGVHAVAEAKLRRLLIDSGFAPAVWKPDLHDGDGCDDAQDKPPEPPRVYRPANRTEPH